MPKVVIIYGQPGSGKGTQANLLQAIKGVYHFDTGRYIEQVIRDPEKLKDKVVKRERKLFDAGILCTPSWVLDIVKKKTLELAKAGVSFAFSGSPRTLFEAFGNSKITGLIEVLEKAYNKKNIHVFYVKVSPKTSIFRNSHRLVCATCGVPVLHKSKVNKCPLCASSLRKRKLDKPEVIKVRLREYQKRTQPILKKLQKRGYKINIIDGEPLPFKVFGAILKKLGD